MEIAELYPAEKMKPRRRYKCSSCSAPAYLKKKSNNSPRSEKKEQKKKEDNKTKKPVIRP